MHTHWLESTIPYDGSQLRPHWILEQTGRIGDAVVAFVGPARVDATHMVDWEDRRAQAWIASDQMLHFIVEHFATDLTTMILWQRLLMGICRDVITTVAPTVRLERHGDDLMCGERKLSVSIATASPVSALIHAGLNVLTTNTPVPTAGLADWNLDPRHIATQVMQRYADEVQDVGQARCKVRPVG